MPLGDQTKQVSGREELLKARVTSGHGAPAHTPEVAAQTYWDVDSAGTYYSWSAGAWSSALTTAGA